MIPLGLILLGVVRSLGGTAAEADAVLSKLGPQTIEQLPSKVEAQIVAALEAVRAES